MAVKAGDIVQLDPAEHTHHDGFWAGQLLIVTEPKPWGVQGYVQVPDGRAYYRASEGTFIKVGAVEWMPADEQEE